MSEKLQEAFDQVQSYVHPLLWKAATVFGLFKFLQWGWSFNSFLWRHLCRPLLQGKQHTYKKYSNGLTGDNGSWAVVTGGSDGIGLAMCKKMASEGFNICIVARNEEKIKQKLNEIEVECRQGDKTFKTMYVIADFANLWTVQDYQKTIASKLAHLDIGVLAINAGYADMGPFNIVSDQEIEKQMQINAVHALYTMKVMSRQMLDRYDAKALKSGVVITSSQAGTVPLSGIATYSSVKAFKTHLAKCLSYEFKGKVDVLSYNPGYVTTKMSNKKQTSMNTISEARSADVAFRDLGCEVSSAASFRHEVDTFHMLLYPTWMIQRSIMKMSWVVYDLVQKRRAAEAKKQ